MDLEKYTSIQFQCSRLTLVTRGSDAYAHSSIKNSGGKYIIYILLNVYYKNCWSEKLISLMKERSVNGEMDQLQGVDFNSL